MGNLADSQSPPAEVPATVARRLQQLDDHELRETILYAQALLRRRGRLLDEFEPGPGEEIVDVVEHPEYVEVVKRQPCGAGCDDCPHGPYVYHVTREPHPDGRTSLHWTFVGRRVADDESS